MIILLSSSYIHRLIITYTEKISRGHRNVGVGHMGAHRAARQTDDARIRKGRTRKRYTECVANGRRDGNSSHDLFRPFFSAFPSSVESSRFFFMTRQSPSQVVHRHPNLLYPTVPILSVCRWIIKWFGSAFFVPINKYNRAIIELLPSSSDRPATKTNGIDW